ncbi:MAG: pilus assembly protein [Anaerolineaceae bacterium]|nr:pilus assembly protein [Anaerolineaceae bacterium]
MPEKLVQLRHIIRRLSSRQRQKGQSFLELALIIPIMLILLLGVVEVAFFLGSYLDLLDLTREAARFASVRDPFTVQTNTSLWDCGPAAAGTEIPFDFYYQTSCVFAPPAGSAMCTNPKFCNGLNSFIAFNPATDDIVISVFTISNALVTNGWPSPDGYWAFSDHDADTTHNDNWKRDCQGNEVRTEPYFNETHVQGNLSTSASTLNKGFVGIEFYYCYEQALALPIMNNFIPNPLRAHVYTLMPLPAAQPSPTPKPAP